MSFSLNKPSIGSTGWGNDLNDNFLKLQNILANVAQTVDTSIRSTASSTFVDSGLSVSLPFALSASTHKVFVRVSLQITSNLRSTPSFKLYRDATDLTPAGMDFLMTAAVDAASFSVNVSFAWIDAPGATAIQPYKIYWNTNGGTAYMGGISTSWQTPNVMIAQEIPA